MSRFRKIRDYDPKSLISIIFDIATLLPINEVYYLLLYVSGREMTMNNFFRKAVRIKSALRLYRVKQYSSKMKGQAGRDQILIIGLSHFVTSALIIHVLAAIWYNMACFKCEYENWATAMEDTHVFDPSSIFQWFIVCYTNIGIAFQHCYKGKFPQKYSFFIKKNWNCRSFTTACLVRNSSVDRNNVNWIFQSHGLLFRSANYWSYKTIPSTTRIQQTYKAN